MLREKDSAYQYPKIISVSEKIKQYPAPQGELDLHGFTADKARLETGRFLNNSRFKGLLTIRIIVGKGLHSESGPVLPDIVEETVQDFQEREIVLAYRWDKSRKSKSGAVIIYLNQSQ